MLSLLHTWTLAAALLGPKVELVWRAPTGCPTAAEVLVDVDRALTGRTITTPVAVDVEISPTVDGFAASVTLDRSAPRTLRATRCTSLTRAVTLVIAVAIDPSVHPADPAIVPPTPPVEPSEPPPIVPRPIDPSPIDPIDPPAPPPPSPREPTTRSPRVRHGLGVRGGLATGASTLATGTASLVYALERGLLRVEARALYVTPSRLLVSDEIAIRVQALTLGALACVAPGGAWLRVPLCLGAEAGPMIGGSLGIPAPRVRADLWASALLAAAVVARVHRRLNLVVAAEFAGALRRPAFRIGDREPVRAPAYGARITLGVEFVLGR